MNIVKKEDFSDFDADVDKKTDTFIPNMRYIV